MESVLYLNIVSFIEGETYHKCGQNTQNYNHAGHENYTFQQQEGNKPVMLPLIGLDVVVSWGGVTALLTDPLLGVFADVQHCFRSGGRLVEVT